MLECLPALNWILFLIILTRFGKAMHLIPRLWDLWPAGRVKHPSLVVINKLQCLTFGAATKVRWDTMSQKPCQSFPLYSDITVKLQFTLHYFNIFSLLCIIVLSMLLLTIFWPMYSKLLWLLHAKASKQWTLSFLFLCKTNKSIYNNTRTVNINIG